MVFLTWIWIAIKCFLVVALIAALFDLAGSPVMAADNPPPEADGAQALYDEAKQQGWTIISMKNDWKRIFAFEP